MYRIDSFLEGNIVRASISLDGFKNPQTHRSGRFDSVRILIDCETGKNSITLLQDVGEAVLQPQSTSLKRELTELQAFSEALNLSGQVRAFAEMLIIVILSQLTGIRLTDRGGTAEAASIDVMAELEFEQLLEIASKPEMNFPNRRESAITLSEDGLRLGAMLNILRRSQNGLYPRNELIFQTPVNESALKAAEECRSLRRSSGIFLPPRFDDIDLGIAAQALTAIECPTASTVCFFGDTNSPHCGKRSQAAAAYPALAELFAHESRFQKVIDEGSPLAPAIGERLRLSKAHIRRLGRLAKPLPANRIFGFGEAARGIDPLGVDRARRYGLAGELTLEQFCGLIRGIPQDWVPGSDSAWCDFIDIASACILPISAAMDRPPEPMLATSKGDWRKFRMSLASAYGVPVEDFDRRQMALATSDIFEMIDDFSRSILLPLFAYSINSSGQPLPDLLANELLSARQLSFQIICGKARNVAGELFTVSRRWMSRIPALIDIEADDIRDRTEFSLHADGKSCPKLVELYTAANGLVVQNLTTAPEFIEESRRLSHCLGRSYLKQAMQGNCHIFSVRSADLTASHSTIELTPPQSGLEKPALAELRIVQHKGLMNRKPPDAAKVACAEWLAALKEGKLQTHLNEAWQWREECRRISAENKESPVRDRMAIEAAWSAALGINWHDHERRNAVWNEWKKHILSGRFSHAADPGYLFRAKEVREFMCRMSPRATRTLSEKNNQDQEI
ncbi:MAG: PcfJ domain-containing protein [Rhodobacteraceae bacterium]|nr:PcfJ domain-containing protein [Paracoccaceae bacterium]